MRKNVNWLAPGVVSIQTTAFHQTRARFTHEILISVFDKFNWTVQTSSESQESRRNNPESEMLDFKPDFAT